MKKVKYGILNTKTNELLEYETETNDGEFCADVAYTLTECGEHIWLVDKEETAENAILTNPEWYNAYYNTPKKDLNVSEDKLEVVRVTFVIERVDEIE